MKFVIDPQFVFKVHITPVEKTNLSGGTGTLLVATEKRAKEVHRQFKNNSTVEKVAFKDLTESEKNTIRTQLRSAA